MGVFGVPNLSIVNAVRIDIHDTDYTILPTDYLVSVVAPLTAPRIMTLPDATSEVPIGKMYIIKDESYTAGNNHILVIGFNDQPIDNQVNGIPIQTHGGSMTVVCNGVSWYIV